jgi:hypothetical protein
MDGACTWKPLATLASGLMLPPILPPRGVDHMHAPLDTIDHDSRLRELQRITKAMKRQNRRFGASLETLGRLVNRNLASQAALAEGISLGHDHISQTPCGVMAHTGRAANSTRSSTYRRLYPMRPVVVAVVARLSRDWSTPDDNGLFAAGHGAARPPAEGPPTSQLSRMRECARVVGSACAL